MHGIDFSQMPPQCSSCAHLDSANRVDVGCDLKIYVHFKKISTYKWGLIHLFKLGSLNWNKTVSLHVEALTCDSVASAQAFLASYKKRK